MANNLLAVTGLAQSGKSVLTKHVVERYGFETITASSIINDALNVEQGPGLHTRDELRNMGARLRKLHGPDFIVRMALERESSKILIDGLRNYSAYKTLISKGGLTIGVVARPEVRFERGKIERDYKASHATIENMLASEAKELNSLDPNGMQILPILWSVDPECIIDTSDINIDQSKDAIDVLLQHHGIMPILPVYTQ